KAWDGVERVYKLTRMDEHEYETSFFYLEGETLQTTPLRGSRNQVSAQHTLQLKYQIDSAKRVYNRHVFLDNKLIHKQPIPPEKISRETEIGFLFNIHSHPQHINSQEQVTYS